MTKLKVMDGKFYDISFRLRSRAGDFSCPDGELASTSGCIVSDSDSLYSDDNDEFGALVGEYASEMPPVPEVSFALVRRPLSGWHVHPDTYPVKNVSSSKSDTDSWGKVAREVLAQFEADALGQSLFTSPFFIMGAWRLKTGGLVSHSNPVLLVPNTGSPLLSLVSDLTTTPQDMRVARALGSIYWQLSLPEQLRDWVGKIDSLEILVSRQQQLYDKSRDFNYALRGTTDSYCESLDTTLGIISRQIVCTEPLSNIWRPAAADATVSDSSLSSLNAFYTVASFSLGSLAPITSYAPLEVNCGNLATIYSGQSSIKDISSSTAGNTKNPVIVASGDDFSLHTRPFKLSGASRLKSLRKVFLRGHFNPREVSVSVYGSRDMLHWYLLGKRNGGGTVFLNTVRSRFYRFVIEGTPGAGSTFEGLSIYMES